MSEMTTRVMDEALQWGAGQADHTSGSHTAPVEAEATRLASGYPRETLEEALWTLSHATDLTDGRVKARAITALEVAVATAPESPLDLA